jgi:hypothetical protein
MPFTVQATARFSGVTFAGWDETSLDRVEELHFTNLLIIAAVAFAAPLALGLAPKLRLPGVVLEIVAGIMVGPAVLGWVEVDTPVRVLALVGLAFLLFLAGLEIDFERLRGRPLAVAGLGFVASFSLALLVGVALDATNVVDSPLLVAIILSATSLGIGVPVLKDQGEVSSPFGQLVIAQDRRLGTDAGDVAAVHRRRLGDRDGTGRARRGNRCCVDRCRACVSPRFPGKRPFDPSPRRDTGVHHAIHAPSRGSGYVTAR